MAFSTELKAKKLEHIWNLEIVTLSRMVQSARLDHSKQLTFVCFDGEAGANQVAVAVDVVDAGDGRPELAAAHPFGGEGGRFPTP